MGLDAVLVGARLLLFASTLVLFGTPLFLLYAIEPSAAIGTVAATPWRGPRRLLPAAAVLALLASTGWLIAQTAVVAGQPGSGIGWADVYSVVTDTQFGAIAAARIALIVVLGTVIISAPPSRALWGIEAVLGAVLVGSFAGSGHGTLGQGAGRALHAGSDILHLLAAGLWIGALVPLALLMQSSFRTQDPLPPERAAMSLERFSGVGPAAVAVLVVTGVVNSAYLIGASRWRELFTSAYGRLLILKLALFVGMLALATVNRYRLSPRLRLALQAGALDASALRAFRRIVFIETGLAFAVLGVVALFGMLAPPVSASP